MTNLAPTKRFSSRVDSYIQYRPRYPQAILPFLHDAVGLTRDHVIADVGSGTGFLSELFLANGNAVYGVEPNADMREAGEVYLAAQNLPGDFTSIDGTAENTTLADHSVDLVTAGQAFHWFEPGSTRREFARILRPGGFVVLVWNTRDRDGSPFMQASEALLDEVSHDRPGSQVNAADESIFDKFFGESGYQRENFRNGQRVDFEGLLGRTVSSSYSPLPGEAKYERLESGLREIFEQYAEGGEVEILYETRVFWGRIA